MYIYVYLEIYLYICIFRNTFVYMYIFMHVYVYIYVQAGILTMSFFPGPFNPILSWSIQSQTRFCLYPRLRLSLYLNVCV